MTLHDTYIVEIKAQITFKSLTQDHIKSSDSKYWTIPVK